MHLEWSPAPAPAPVAPCAPGCTRAGRNVVIVGDSINRFVFWALVRSLGEATPMAHNTTVEKHSDFSWDAEDGSGTHLSFLWAPEVADLSKRVRMRWGGGE